MEVSVTEVSKTPKGECVLDFGQNMTGWDVFNGLLKVGWKVRFEFGEVLQDGNFYNANYQLAVGGFTYISDGKKRLVRPHFTYFGFRYVRVSGMENIQPKDFAAWGFIFRFG